MPFAACVHPGTSTARMTLQHDLLRPASLARCFSASTDVAFARELQTRITAAEAASRQVSYGSQRLAGVTPGTLSCQSQNMWGASRLVAAAAVAAGALMFGLLGNQMRSQSPTPATQQAQVNADLLLQHQLQQSLTLPQPRPAALRMCLHWLQDREALLRSELTALQSLLPACRQPLRQEEIAADLQSNDVMVAALTVSSHE